MVGDLISRSEVLAALSSRLSIVDMVRVAEIVESVPAVEAEPVVYARWIYENDGWVCSHCAGEALQRVEYARGCYMGCDTVESNRCPHCGAHMDEEVKE